MHLHNFIFEVKYNCMVSKLLFATLIFSLFFGVSNAQFGGGAWGNEEVEKSNKKMNAPEEIAKQFTSKWTKKLSLDEAVSKKLYTAVLANAQKMEEIRTCSTTKKEEALKTCKSNFESELKVLLTAEQFEKILRSDDLKDKKLKKPKESLPTANVFGGKED